MLDYVYSINDFILLLQKKRRTVFTRFPFLSHQSWGKIIELETAMFKTK